MPDLRAIVAAQVAGGARVERRLLSKYNSVIEEPSRKPPAAPVSSTLPTKYPPSRARTAEDDEHVFARPSFYAEFAPCEDQAGVVDSIDILKNRGRLTESRMSFASALKELAFVFRERRPGRQGSLQRAEPQSPKKKQGIRGWIGVKFKPNWSDALSVHDPAIVACRDALARVFRNGPSCCDILDTMDVGVTENR
jgi:hypothetical protein